VTNVCVVEKKFVCSRTVARKSSIRGFYVFTGGLDIENKKNSTD